MSFITVKNLNFKYPNGTENVLNDVSLEVTKGEKVAIIGQNGAGKTTMVKMLNGLLKPVSGDVVVDDWNTKNYTVAKMSRKVGYVFQNPMDEPTAGQDFRGMRVLHNLIDELQKQGKTIITITHDMEFVVKNFDRVIVMTNGEVIADGDKRDIFWQFDTLEKSMVKQPYISDLAKEMEIGGKVLSVEEFVENYKK